MVKYVLRIDCTPLFIAHHFTLIDSDVQKKKKLNAVQFKGLFVKYILAYLLVNTDCSSIYQTSVAISFENLSLKSFGMLNYWQIPYHKQTFHGTLLDFKFRYTVYCLIDNNI
jgi:hypothetical protein